MKEFTSLESKDEKMERRVKLEYFFFIGLFITLIFMIICTLIYFSIPSPSYSGSARVSIASDLQGRFILFAMILCFSPFVLIILYGIMTRFKTYRVLKQRYIEKFGSKPKISIWSYVLGSFPY